jgi:NAD(P)-dependent dehydrogenase (short-subunit alcohol dehydrogenase family)
MKIAITGHTKGIGKAIAGLYYTDQVVGFSRSNGYDISKSKDVKLIIENTIEMDCDVFVNNAYNDTAQTTIFETLLKHWNNNSTKTIVNINSRTIYNGPNQRKYTADKKLLRSSAINAIRDINRKCRVININPGYVRTDMVAHVDVKMLTPEQLAAMIKWCLDQPQGIEVGELSVWCTTLD